MTAATDFARALAELEREGREGGPAEALLMALVEAHRFPHKNWITVIPFDPPERNCGPLCEMLDRIADALDAARRTPCCGVALGEPEGLCPRCREHV